MTTESSKNQKFIRKHPSEGMDALEKEAKLPLNGWENEVANRIPIDVEILVYKIVIII